MTYTESDSKYKRYTITSALPYANGPVHIGHLAGVYVPADIYARYLRQCGEDVIFIGGSDEHGVPITIKARKEGVSPQQVVDRYHEIIRSSFEQLGISFDIYSRTSCEEHHRTAAAYFKELYDKGVFVKRSSMQYYDEEAGQFLADRYITGTCPHCGNEHAYGDQCEACGTSLNATDLINPRSTLSGNPPVMRETEHWYLPLDRYEEWLRSWIVEGHKGDWKTNVYGQCKSWIDAGLQPRAVTRDLDWGVKVPIEGADGKVLYVWFDAPIGYISFTKQLKGDDWERWWKADDTKLVHFIGKDNIVFHCIIFPTMLKAEGSYIMPANVPANEFLNLEGNKISTSRNWAVWLHEYLQEMPGKQDVLRYTLCANAPETKDNDFTWKDFQLKNNSELVAILGNFVNRTLVLTHKFYDGKVPEAQLDERDRATLQEMATYPERIGRAIERYTFREALSEMMNLARLGNRYLTETEPWKQIKQQPERAAASLYVSLQICAALAIVCEPFLPFTAAKLGKMLNLGASSSQWRKAAECQLPSGHAITTPELLFEQIPDETIAAQVAKLEATKQANEAAAWQPAPVKQAIVFDDFTKLDLRVGRVLECSRVPKADKLLSFRIDDGMGGRTIVSGIAKYYTDPSQLVGRQVCFIANLPPRKLKGIESQGMILSAEDKDGRLVLLTPDSLVAQGVNIG